MEKKRTMEIAGSGCAPPMDENAQRVCVDRRKRSEGKEPENGEARDWEREGNGRSDRAKRQGSMWLSSSNVDAVVSKAAAEKPASFSVPEFWLDGRGGSCGCDRLGRRRQ
ncbi:MAG: hypothetical protein IJ468_14225 [Lachnospiraceae bacterium]|nr:hypothetical protein [Lachnospiraceae bacterium]